MKPVIRKVSPFLFMILIIGLPALAEVSNRQPEWAISRSNCPVSLIYIK